MDKVVANADASESRWVPWRNHHDRRLSAQPQKVANQVSRRATARRCPLVLIQLQTLSPVTTAISASDGPAGAASRGLEGLREPGV